jgi:hypothetical protein
MVTGAESSVCTPTMFWTRHNAMLPLVYLLRDISLRNLGLTMLFSN